MGNIAKMSVLLIVLLLLLCGCETTPPLEPSEYSGQTANSINHTDTTTLDSSIAGPVLTDKIILYRGRGDARGDIRDDWLDYASSKYGEGIFTIWGQEISSDHMKELHELPIKAIIADFTYGLVEHFDLAASLQKIREECPELLIISIRPCEFIDEVIELSDLVIFDDYVAWGQRIPQFAADHGVQALVNIGYEITEPEEPEYNTDHFNYGLAFHYANRVLFAQSLQQTCEALELSYTNVFLEQELSQDYKHYETIVLEKVQYYQNSNSSTCFIYPSGGEDLNQKVCETGAYLLPMITSETDRIYVSSFMLADERLAFANGIDKRFDYARVNRIIAEGVARIDATGRVFRDPASNIMLPIEAATKYALAFIAGDTSLITVNQDFFSQCLQETMDEFGCSDYQVYVNTYEGYESNCLFFSTDLIVY